MSKSKSKSMSKIRHLFVEDPAFLGRNGTRPLEVRPRDGLDGATGLNPYNRSLSSRSCSLTSKQRTHKFLVLLSPIAALHLSRTLYKSALFMQNEPNFQKSQVNVTSLITVAYENKSNWTLGENEPNTNPIKANFRKARMNVNSLITKDYRK